MSAPSWSPASHSCLQAEHRRWHQRLCEDDSGISVFSVAASGVLTHVDSVDDSEDPSLRLDLVGELTTAVVGVKTFLFAPSGGNDDGISVFEIAGNGALTHVQWKG